MKRICSTSILVFVVLTLACGGSDNPSTSVVGGGPGVNASFTPEQASPGADTVSMGQVTASGNLVTVAVNLTDVSDVYGAQFDVDFDASRVSYQGFSAGSVFEQGGHSPTYVVQSPGSGLLVVAISRNGAVAPVSVTGTQRMVSLTFRLNASGSFPVSFQGSPALSDDNVPPQDVPGIVWFAGTLLGS